MIDLEDEDEYSDDGWQYTREMAERDAWLPEVLADVAKYGDRLVNIDQSIRIHKATAPDEPFNTWEWPRRLAVHYSWDEQQYGGG